MEWTTARPNRMVGVGVTGLQTIFLTASALALDPFDDNPQAREDAERVLKQTPEGRAALAFAEERGITTLYQDGGSTTGSSYNPQLNAIRIQGAGWAGSEGLAAEFVRQVEIARNRWDTSDADGDYESWNAAREKEEQAANQAAYRMGSQLGHEEAARHTFLENSGDSGAYSTRGRYSGFEYENSSGPGATLTEYPYRVVEGIFQDGPLDLKP
ncbi:hypothetical protein ACFQYP_32860 [Nonomuraea antimicrobica]